MQEIQSQKQIIGFIGCGNMAKAMIAGLVSSGYVKPTQIIASNPSKPSLEECKTRWGIATTQDNTEVARKSQWLILAVKPYLYETVINQIQLHLSPETVVIMIAAGQTLKANEARFKQKVKLIKAMPNTPSMVGEGMSAICANSQVTPQEFLWATGVFASFGRVEQVKEEWMDVVAGVSGSSPAYTYLFIEALADGAVLKGMPRKLAYTFAAQAVLGSAKMVLETGLHPGELKDMVCSPGGTTIEAVAQLEAHGLRSAVIEAVRACTERSDQMSKQ